MVDHKAIEIQALRNKINNLKLDIQETSKWLIQAQTIVIKTALSRKSNWLYRIQNKFYGSTVNKSAQMHRERLVLLHKDHRKLQDKLDQLTGSYWRKKILTFLSLRIYQNLFQIIFFRFIINKIYQNLIL